MGSRAVASATFGVLAPLLLLVTSVGCWVRVELVPAEALGQQVRASLRQPEVQDELARRISRSVAETDPRLATAEAVVRTAASILVESRKFADLLDIAVQQTGRAVVKGRAADATRLTDIEHQLVGVAEAVDPDVAARIPRGWDTQVVDLRPGSPIVTALDAGDRLNRAVPALLGATTLSYVGAIALARRRERALARSGCGVALVGAATLGGRWAAGAWLGAQPSTAGASAAVRSAFDVTTAGLVRIGVGQLLVGTTLVLAVAAGAGLPALARRAAARLVRVGDAPRGVGARLGCGFGALVAAALLAASASWAGRLAVLAAAVALTYVGFRFLVDLLPATAALTDAEARDGRRTAAAPAKDRSHDRPSAFDAAPPATHRPATIGGPTPSIPIGGHPRTGTVRPARATSVGHGPGRHRTRGCRRGHARRASALAGATAVALLALLVVLIGGDRAAQAGGAGLVCNGAAELCDRPVDQVTFAGTHNAMASVEGGFVLAQQRSTIADQLAGGVRALLLDTRYGLSTTGGVVWTDLRGEQRSKLVAELGEPTVASIEALRPSLVPTATAPSVYLCHGLCELGAAPAVSELTTVRRFLEDHPTEVVLLFLQDDTEAADTVATLRAAGLDRFAYTHRDGEPWPTLGELVRRATPLIVFAEQHGGAPLWFHRSFDLVQDTDHRVARADQLGCRPARGALDASLFVLNHWVATGPPDERDARQINTHEVIVSRVRRCEKLWHRTVNVVAVNFWERGDLVATVAALNRASDGASPP